MVNSRAISVCGIALALLTNSTVGVAQGGQQATGAISGYVFCADTGLPARFASVRIQSISSLGTQQSLSTQGAQSAAFTPTDFDGSFFIDGLIPGKYLVLVSLAGYLTPLAKFAWHDLTVDSSSPLSAVKQRLEESLTQVTVEAGQTPHVSIRLERGAEIAGTVSYDDGSPAIGMPIEIYHRAAAGNDWQEIDSDPDVPSMKKADDRGQFRITGMPSGNYLLAVSLPPNGYSARGILGGKIRWPQNGPSVGHLAVYYGNTIRQSRATVIEVAPGDRRSGVDMQIPVSKFHTLSGTVAAQYDGHMLKNATLLLSFLDDGSTVLRAHLGADGTFQIPFVLDGDYILAVSAPTEEDSHPPHAYEAVDTPVNVHGDLNGLAITLPDASDQNLKGAP